MILKNFMLEKKICDFGCGDGQFLKKRKSLRGILAVLKFRMIM